MTIFKDIPGFEERYQISEIGEVYSLPKEWVTAGGGIMRHSGKILKTMTDNGGYKHVKLQKNNVGCKSLIHRLVAITYLSNPLNLPEVNHLDGDKSNNNISNLQWCTHRDNVIHAHINGLASTTAAVLSTSIKIINKDTGETFTSAEKAAKSNGFSRRHLLNMLQGKYRNNTSLIYDNSI